MTAAPDPADPTAERQRWMAILARAGAEEMERHLPAPLPPHRRLRGPEVALMMVRGRAGGTGAPFNLGEMTVTRCTVRGASGHIGHAIIAGRDPARAELAAALDAVLQDPAGRAELLACVVQPLADAQAARREAVARRAAATRVEFFTLATMRS